MRYSVRHGRWLWVLALSACTPVAATSGAPAAPPEPAPEESPAIPLVEGRWTGFLSMEGQGLNGSLRIEQDADRLSGVFEAPDIGMVAEGDGSIEADGRLVLRLAYDLQCPGTAELTGRRAENGTVIDGTLTASDCTGSSEGSFTFRR